MILISAGHHPYNKGACYKKFCEFDEAKYWQSLICNALGYDALSVPAGVLSEKVDFINSQANVELAVEIHFNSAVQWVDKDGDGVYDEGEDEHVGRGSETLYYPNSVKGIVAAKIVQSYMSKVLIPDRGIKEGWYKMNPANGADYFLKRVHAPALIIEPEFIHRKELIQSKRLDACNDIALGLLKARDQLNESNNE